MTVKLIAVLTTACVTTVLLSLSLAAGFTVSSSAFKQGTTIPRRFTCDGTGVSFPLSFGTPPAGTKSYAILGWDDDAPSGLSNQWAAYDIPLTMKGLPEGVPLGATVMGFKQGSNSYGKLGWSAACPAKGAKGHHYYIDLYAIKTATLGLPAAANWNTVHSAIKRTKLLEAKLMGVYSR